jgi:hypothetical protein
VAATENRVTAGRLTGEEGAGPMGPRLLQCAGLPLDLAHGRGEQVRWAGDGGGSSKIGEADGDTYHAHKKATWASLIGVCSTGTKRVVGLAGAQARAEGAAASTNGLHALCSRGAR